MLWSGSQWGCCHLAIRYPRVCFLSFTENHQGNTTRAKEPTAYLTSSQELDLLVSPSIPSATLEALPFACVTQELRIVPAATVEQGQLPADMQVTKLFLRSDVEKLKQEFETVRDMGSGTVDEWLKGLGGRGKDARHQASKWEKWDVSGGVAKMLSQLYPGWLETSGPPIASPTTVEVPSTLAPTLATPNPSLPSLPPVPLPQGRQERTAEEVAKLKAARKAEIERRSLLLDPPLAANVLRHIPSFQAATHIITPLDDSAWELLKPRLITQRAEAELREQEHSSHTKALDERIERHRRLETTLATTKEARDLVDKDWEEIQAPLRARIAAYADEIVRDGWEKGRKVTKDTCPRFAADVLIYVRKRFYAEIAKDAVAAKAAGQTPHSDPLEGPFTQKLTLENMKWIFDTKIKPHTEAHRKELFYCNGCEGNLKAFGFEGVIQHYAAKHTTCLSLGSIIVHWRAEWPEHSPFSPEARVTKQPFLGPVSAPYTVDSAAGPPANYGFQFMVGPPAPPAYPSHPGFGAPPYSDPYHHVPPQSYQSLAPFPIHAPPTGYGPSQQYPPQPSSYPPYQPPGVPYTNGPVDPAPVYNPPQGTNYAHGYGPFQPNAVSAGYTAPGPSLYTDSYQTKLEDIARNSREIWHSLGGVKELPGSAKVFVTIHHLVKRFRFRFYETPPLSLFIEGLSNNKDMRPVRNINGLACKACHLGLGNAASIAQDRKSFSLPQLTNHFQSKHVEPMQAYNAPLLDWVVDMVLLVDEASISNLHSFVGEYQKSLLADALPGIFQLHPAPVTGSHHSQHMAPETQNFSTNSHATSSVGSYGMYHVQASSSQQLSGDQASAENSVDAYPRFKQPFITSGHDGDLYQPHRHDQSDRSEHGHIPHIQPGYMDSMAANGTSSHTNPARIHTRNGEQSPQGHRHEQSSHQTRKKHAGKSKRGKPQGPTDAAKRMFLEGMERDVDETAQDGHSSGATWATDHSQARHTFSSSGRIGSGEFPDIPPAQHHAHNGSRPLRVEPALSQVATKEPNLLSALEMHLDQRRTPMSETGQRPSHPRYADSRNTSVAAETGILSRSNIHYGFDSDRSGSPTHGPRYRPRPGHPGRYETAYEERGLLSDAPSRRFEERRYEGPQLQVADDGHGPEVLADTYRYPEDIHTTRPRQTVEAYEIVHVIDEQGEYYIRRPARHAPEPRYAPELRRDSDDYHTNNAAYLGAATQTRGTDASRKVHVDNPAYYEEYDPRFPGA